MKIVWQNAEIPPANHNNNHESEVHLFDSYMCLLFSIQGL